ncbi:hypothetical protein KSW81_005204 [Nannochloris sp. 'desiccata']|nr:hypothetical protein KSW81_005204 [Chlorella desiccata (nom. nud.)]
MKTTRTVIYDYLSIQIQHRDYHLKKSTVLGLGQGGGLGDQHQQQQAQGRGEIMVDEAELMAEMQAIAEEAGLAGPGDRAGTLHDVNPMIAFLRSLMPWAADGQQPDYTADNDTSYEQLQRREDNNEQHE